MSLNVAVVVMHGAYAYAYALTAYACCSLHTVATAAKRRWVLLWLVCVVRSGQQDTVDISRHVGR